MTEMVTLDEARIALSRLVDRAESGEEILISENGVPRARLVPVRPAAAERQPAGAIGLVELADDFDAPLPSEVLDAFDGRRTID